MSLYEMERKSEVRIARLEAERDALKHDLERHMKIAQDLATEGGLTTEAISFKSRAFLKRMRWWKKKTPLEGLMLLVSEAGEAANELRVEEPDMEALGIELADIVLRTFGLSEELGLDLTDSIRKKMKIWDSMAPGHKGRIK